jgi:hypothetical protein
MARKKKTLDGLKKVVLPFVSGLAFVALLWFILYGKIRAEGILSPIIDRLPKNEAQLVRSTDEVLGTAFEKLKEGKAKEILEKSEETFEESRYTEPARELRDDIREKIDEAVASAKELPVKEIKHIQIEVCKQWLGEEMILAGTAVGN